ncbi:MAG: hypothetical protein DRG78_03800 [Epsilonproteobacteria bacterium]|nr:MAG: hypothetical protein DRG78_03800 [Campylobacterota bacterium]
MGSMGSDGVYRMRIVNHGKNYVPKDEELNPLAESVLGNENVRGDSAINSVVDKFAEVIKLQNKNNEKNKDYTSSEWDEQVKNINPKSLSPIELINKFDSVGMVGTIKDSNLNMLQRLDTQNDINSSKVLIMNESNSIAMKQLEATQIQNKLLESQLKNSIISSHLENEVNNIEIAKGNFEISGLMGEPDNLKQLKNSQGHNVVPIVDKAIKDSEKGVETGAMNGISFESVGDIISDTIDDVLEFGNPFEAIFKELKEDIEREIKNV